MNIALRSESDNSLEMLCVFGKHVELCTVVGVLRINGDGVIQIVKAKTCLNIPRVKMKGFSTEIFTVNELQGIILGQAQCAGGNLVCECGCLF